MGQEQDHESDVGEEARKADGKQLQPNQDESVCQLKNGTAKLTVESNGDLKQTILDGLEKKGDRGLWLWVLFILCLTPNILNGFHVSSYVFLGQQPNNYYCMVPTLVHAGWSHEEIRNITAPTGSARNGTCTILAWNYNQLSNLNYRDALSYTQSHPRPTELDCLSTASTHGWHMYYDQPEGVSIVPEWDLLCERTALRSTVQVALSIGKFVGASSFGVISDKYGRKTSFSIAATLYIVAGLLTTFSPVYALLLLGRIGLGASASGVFYPAFALLTENIGKRHRSWMSIAFNFSYPLGMLFLALAAYLIQPWRDLSLALTVPSFLLIIHLYFLVESPRWLLSKGRERKAFRMVFGRSAPKELLDSAAVAEKNHDVDAESQPAATVPFSTKLKQSVSEFTKLYGTPVLCRRALICHFTWCITSLCYYVTALNADNFAANRNVYVATTGSVDIVAYILSIIVLAYFGRRSSSFCFFLYAGICLLVVLAIPETNTTALVTLAMLGRVGITAVYAIVTLHTAELFPTEIRNTALGICSTMAHVGSIAAPYITDLLGRLAWWIPTTICGCSVLLAGALTLLHPETRDAALKDHAQQEQLDHADEPPPTDPVDPEDVEAKNKH
ncbi:organic cation transporter protein [Anopheles ziemanni]|uniref:organic cation transporter protein n=1 Tax=Anopheles coustani TaxID=139045 RepID=UPI00265866EB|nr:organic cation transporter protein [Anopheles coustani]XP_058169186.1 organic cation transporter protein [Anopheles ziemanni]